MNKQEAQQIIDDTLRVFSQSEIQRTKMDSLPKLNPTVYKSIHQSFLTPLDIKIDTEQFLTEIKQYDSEFVQWGKRYSHLPRLGAALVNTDGLLKGSNDPINGSLYEYNQYNSMNPIFETDCTVHTELMNLPSLEPLSVLNGHYLRSNIFKWSDTAMFVPHIDSVVPSPWIRLWATTDPSTVTVNYFNGEEYTSCTDIEAGRLYIIDTSLVHDANSTGLNYQLFLACDIYSVDLLRMLIQN